MATRKQFCDAMNEVYKNHGVYIGTANGELTESLTVGRIREMEVNYGYAKDKTNKNIRRDFAYIGKCYENGWDMKKSKAGDCSGIIVGVMRELGIIKPTADYSAKGFQKLATPVEIKNLQPGDLVFDKRSEAGHVGVYVGDGIVIDSRGRDVGVVKNKVSDYPWAVGGRLPDNWFDDNFLILTRELYYREGNLMKGDDVKEVQDQLKLEGYNCGASDGVYGKKTKTAVQAFQIEHDLTVDGIVGENTAKALGFIWEG
jgi:hypothetical protein